MMLLALALLFCGLYFSADLVTQLLLGPKWAATGPLLAALAPAGFFLCLYSFLGAVLLGLGNSVRQFMLTALCGVAMLTGALLGTRFDVNGVAIGISIGAALLAPFYLNAIAAELRLNGAMLLSVLFPPLVATAIMASVMIAIHGELAQLGGETQLLAIVVAGTLSFAAAIALTGGRRFIDDLKYFRPWGPREIGVD
jgi:lipopolysaccharide exporter